MHKSLVVVVLTTGLLPGLARAEARAFSTDPLPQRALERSVHMKKHGIAASILGIIQLAVGSAAGVASLVSMNECKNSIRPCGDFGSGLITVPVGATFTILGGIAATAGIPMWVYGAREERAQKLSLSASATGLRLSF